MKTKQKINPIEELRSKLIKIRFMDTSAKTQKEISFKDLQKKAKEAAETFSNEPPLQPTVAF